MKSIALFSFLTVYFVAINLFNCVNATNSTEPKKLLVEIFYETLCVDSMRFIRGQVYEALKMNEWLPFTDLKFIPYGKVQAFTSRASNTTYLFCQHGDRECELNALHACIVEHNTVEQQLEMFKCMLKNYRPNVDKCSRLLNIDVSAAKNCKNTRKTSDILKKYGTQTNAIGLTFVPAIAMNGAFDPEKQPNSYSYNFAEEMCRNYKKAFGTTLSNC